jgi:hypothetical protein
MGIQDKAEVELIRRAYVRTKQRHIGFDVTLAETLGYGSLKRKLPHQVDNGKVESPPISFLRNSAGGIRPSASRGRSSL